MDGPVPAQAMRERHQDAVQEPVLAREEPGGAGGLRAREELRPCPHGWRGAVGAPRGWRDAHLGVAADALELAGCVIGPETGAPSLDGKRSRPWLPACRPGEPW
jgi:hypothetical protein